MDAERPGVQWFLLRNIERGDDAIGGTHEPLLAPPPELLMTYRSNKDWPGYETGFLAVMQERGVPATARSENCRGGCGRRRALESHERKG
jgi:hypothetical protein